MKLDHETPERYQHKDGRNVLQITELRNPKNAITHIVVLSDGEWALWHQSDNFIIETPKGRWQGIDIEDNFNGAQDLGAVHFDLEIVKSSGYTHAINLNTLQIVKL